MTKRVMCLLCAIGLSSTLGARGASGTTFSCRRGLVAEGDRLAQVLRKCGPPTHRDRRVEERREVAPSGRVSRTQVTIDEWTYDLGPSSLIRILLFEDGRLDRVDTGGYGDG
ncbi:MAG: DUF2845 domain-containing protein [Proteobacteria bacterium]|nr:DUF2845 domain-containing protein [Pseudomonadota bacterium]